VQKAAMANDLPSSYGVGRSALSVGPAFAKAMAGKAFRSFCTQALCRVGRSRPDCLEAHRDQGYKDG